MQPYIQEFKKMSVLLRVSNMERSIEFYTEKLGFDLNFHYEDFYTGIVKDGSSIHLKSGKSSIDKNKRSSEDPNIIFSVEGIENLYEDLLSKSVEMVQPLRDMPYGVEFYIADPDGNIIAFIES